VIKFWVLSVQILPPWPLAKTRYLMRGLGGQPARRRYHAMRADGVNSLTRSQMLDASLAEYLSGHDDGCTAFTARPWLTIKRARPLLGKPAGPGERGRLERK
jgi:hypothetical protein